MTFQTGQVINRRYRIVKKMGQGGFGVIYKAWDLTLNRACALKENLDKQKASQDQFEHEAHILANLDHPNLARVTDYFLLPGQDQFLVMDYIDGKDLDEILQGGALPLSQIIPWIQQICDALNYLHQQQHPIIHRDIKPANIKITPEGNAVLVDFGIAKIYHPNVKTTKGAKGITPGFSPPEQYGQGTTDARTDIYALGATIFSLLTAKTPSEGTQRMINDDLESSFLGSQVPAPVQKVIAHAMELHPDKRYGDILEFKRAFLRSTQPNISPFTFTPVFLGFLFIGLLTIFCSLGIIGFRNFTATKTPTATLLILTKTSTYIPKTKTLTPTLTSTKSITPSLAFPTLTPTVSHTPKPATITRTPTRTRTVTVSPTKGVPTPNAAFWRRCNASYKTRLMVGMIAKVSSTPPKSNNLREGPGLSRKIIGSIAVSEQVRIVGGPSCSDHWIWWQVISRQNGETGWTAEGDKQNYWLIPLPQ